MSIISQKKSVFWVLPLIEKFIKMTTEAPLFHKADYQQWFWRQGDM